MGKKWLKFLSVKKKSPKPSSAPKAGNASEDLPSVEASSAAALEASTASAAQAQAAPLTSQITPVMKSASETSVSIPDGIIDTGSASAIKMQTAFRAFLVTKDVMVDDFVQARRALRALKGLVRLQALVRGHAVRRQAAVSLGAVLSIVKVQALARGYLVRTSKDGQCLQKEIWQKRQGSKEPSEQQAEVTNGQQISHPQVTSKAKPTKAQVGKFSRKLLAYLDQQQEKQQPTANAASDRVWLERWTAAGPWKAAAVEMKGASKANSLQNGSQNGETENAPTKRRKAENSKVPSYMAATESAKAKLRLSSPKASTTSATTTTTTSNSNNSHNNSSSSNNNRESSGDAVKRRYSLPGTHGRFQDPITHPRRLSFPVRAR